MQSVSMELNINNAQSKGFESFKMTLTQRVKESNQEVKEPQIHSQGN